ncbi:hypothetical protein AXG93_267s1010 [Marchantia polymorpha subsp. ruderalis]|uniref:non-specific serine/threonine protein kinase n=1 Tax=Marchantia polymorpha subsp. ruderalis TaxID=1480154 RepID=A0A176VKX4_MARPO|nr:hypothetical protein AXG93_267s1010 [Marchantia polymorpha subsp. ruderalis]
MLVVLPGCIERTSSRELVGSGTRVIREDIARLRFREKRNLERAGGAKVGKYEVGRTIGEGTFAKVKFAQNTETGESVAMKVLDKKTILQHKMVDQIKREISVMKLVRHPNVVRLHEVHQGRLTENESRRYFQQLIDAVDYCHSKGVYHRDLKPENLLLDAQGNLKISDFGLSALPQQLRDDGLLHTTCGTPNYVAPEVLNDQGYDGAVADVWSCGVILYVLMAGFLPFDEADLVTLYRKIHVAEFQCPPWFSTGARSLITRILDPNPQTRIKISGIRRDEWFRRNYVPVRMHDEDDSTLLDDVEAVFDDSEDQYVNEQKESKDGPSMMNAFELITLAQGLNLSVLFDRRQDHVRRQTRFTSKKPAKEIMGKMEEAAKALGFTVQTRSYKIFTAHSLLSKYIGDGVLSLSCYVWQTLKGPALVSPPSDGKDGQYMVSRCFRHLHGELRECSDEMRLEGVTPGRGGNLSVAIEVFEVVPSLYMIEVRKAVGDTLEYHKFYKSFCSQLTDIIWKSAAEAEARNMMSQ